MVGISVHDEPPFIVENHVVIIVFYLAKLVTIMLYCYQVVHLSYPFCSSGNISAASLFAQL